MDLERYADKRERYPLPEQMESAGNVVDPVTGHVLSVGIMTYRRTYAQVGYVCDQGAPKELHACVCSMLSRSRAARSSRRPCCGRRRSMSRSVQVESRQRS